MALQVTAGTGSLIAVGMSIGDVATLYSLGRRFGNWVTAQSGDTQFLDMLQSDELDILRRRGMIDTARFNKRWGKRARLLLNGRPTELVDNDAAKILGDFSRFTMTMVAVVAALDGFLAYRVLKDVMKRLLKELLRTTEFGEDVLASQLSDRVNAWRSAAYVRGLSVRVLQIRQDLIASQKVLTGYMPAREAPELTEFLVWLLAGTTDIFKTASSDVAGIAVALSEVAFDMLRVEGWGSRKYNTGCRLVYDPQMISMARVPRGFLLGEHGNAYLWREQSTSVPLAHPEESFSSYPITTEVANAARQAWIEGKQAARSVELRLKRTSESKRDDLIYEFVDLGSPPGRVNSSIFALAQDRGLCVNAELCQGLGTTLERMDDSLLAWLHAQKGAHTMVKDNVASVSMNDQQRIDAFSIYQAFVYGYYYEIFLRLVDTSGLAVAVVDGAWGYRSEELMSTIRELAVLKPLTRENLLKILAALLFSYHVEMPPASRSTRCVGVVGKRALLANSLVTKSDSIETVGRFTLVDVDVGGIPCNGAGLVRAGEAETLEGDWLDLATRVPSNVVPRAPDDDFTKHIEPDWDTDPETMLLVMRYRGRRVLAVNPAVGDGLVVTSYVDPVPSPAPIQQIPGAVEYTVDDFLAGKQLYPKDKHVKVVIQAKGRPGIRYAAVASYQPNHMMNRELYMATPHNSHIALATNCVVAAAERIAYIVVT